MKFSVPIMFLIALATLLSTAASLAGGLIMYFEGLKALRDTVVETSKSELDGLRAELLDPVNTAIEGFENMLYATYSPDIIDNDNTSQWIDTVGQQLYAGVRSFPDELSLLIVAAPKDPYESSTFYTGVWSEPLFDGGRTFILSSYGEHLKEDHSVVEATATAPKQVSMISRMKLMSPVNGSVLEEAGTFDAGPYLTALGEWDLDRDGGLPDDTWRPRNEPGTRILGDNWREPTVWVMFDGGVKAYNAYMALFRPPPPPHPWSKYRIVMCQVEMWYEMWQRRVDAFSAGKPEITVVVYDRKRKYVFATTTPEKTQLANQECNINALFVPPYCLAAVHNMSAMVQEAFYGMGKEAYSDLVTKTFDGDEFYALNAPLVGDVEIMWLRPTSTIKGKVQTALTYLIIFSVLVLVFDCLVSVSEVFFIAMPLKKLEFAIDQIGAMRTEAALEVLAEFEKTKVAVWEIRSVFAGMLTTTEQLQEYKAFMPQSVLYSSGEESASSKTTNNRTGRAPSTRSSATCTTVVAKQRTDMGTLTKRKRVTVLYCNLRGFLPLLESSEVETVGIHTKYVEEVMLHTKVLHGMIDDLSGDRMSVSFNTVSASTGHEQKGAILAARIVLIPETSDIGELKPAVAVSAGSALVGNVGCAALKKYSIFGAVPADVRRLLEAGKEWEIRALCNDQIAKQAGTAVMIRHVAPALVNGRRMLVSEIVEQLGAQAAEEWMYQLEKAESDNPHAANNQIMECLSTNAIEEAGKHMESCTCPVVRAIYDTAAASGEVQPMLVGCVAPLPAAEDDKADAPAS